jgi:hypothetical protein
MRHLISCSGRAYTVRHLGLALLIGSVLLLSGCMEAVVETGEAGGAAAGAEAAGAEAAAAEPAEAAADAGTTAETAERGSVAEGEEGGAEETSAALRAAEDSSQSARYVARVNEDGLMEAVDEYGSKSEVVGRFDGEGQLYEVNRAGRPTNVVAKLVSGKLWEVNQAGLPVRVIGSVRVAISGDAMIDVHAGPDLSLSRIAALRPGDVIEITGGLTEWERSWLSVKLRDGQEGWIPRVAVAGGSENGKRDGAASE